MKELGDMPCFRGTLVLWVEFSAISLVVKALVCRVLIQTLNPKP